MYTVGSIFQTTYTTSKTMFPGNTLGQQQLQSGSGKRKKELREQMRLLNGCGKSSKQCGKQGLRGTIQILCGNHAGL